MNEKKSLESYPTRETEQGLPSKEEWDRTTARSLEINPQMTSEEVVKLLQATDPRINPFLSESKRKNAAMITKLRNKRLEDNGYNPEEWAYYSSPQPEKLVSGNLSAQFTEEDMEKLSERFPKGIELFVIQGQIIEKSDNNAHGDSEESFTQIPHFWEVYVRVKPQELNEGAAMIDGPQDKPTS